jgi:hypothetical protein
VAPLARVRAASSNVHRRFVSIRASRLACAAFAWTIVAACSGASSDLLGPAAPGGDDAGGSSDATSNGDGGQGHDAGSDAARDSGGSGDDTGTSTDGGGIESGPPPDPGIYCGLDQQQAPKYCSLSTQMCCLGYGQTGFNCVPNNGQCLGTPIHCDDTADCPNQVCCGTRNAYGYSDVSCAQSCTGYGKIRFCDPKANDCPSQQSCIASQVLTGFNVCQ